MSNGKKYIMVGLLLMVIPLLMDFAFMGIHNFETDVVWWIGMFTVLTGFMCLIYAYDTYDTHNSRVRENEMEE